MKQKELIEGKSWDILIVLDACRYDIFKSVYKKYISGNLKKCISSGTNTPQWLIKTFNDSYGDTVYVSGNPYINGLGVAFRQAKKNIAGYFQQVIDVWDKRFDPIFKTVHPIELNKAYHTSMLTHPQSKYIIHYVQPHVPYVVVEEKYLPKSGWFNPSLKNKNHSKVKKFLWRQIINKHVIPISMIWRLQDLLGKYPDPVGKIYLDHSWQGVRKAYTDNLHFVLSHVSNLINRIDDKKIIITSDHGEYLGEFGMFGHGGIPSQTLLNVPWLEIVK